MRPPQERHAGDDQRQQNAEQRHSVLEQHSQNGGVVAVPGDALPAAQLAQGDAEGERLERQREQQQAEHQQRERLDDAWAEQRVSAVVDVESAADEEHADGRYQRPEEFLLATAERMQGVGTRSTAHFTDLEQHLIGNIGD